MLINFSQIKKLPVYTVSGTYLGKVVDVIEISTKKITVEDAILPDPLKAENAGEAAMG